VAGNDDSPSVISASHSLLLFYIVIFSVPKYPVDLLFGPSNNKGTSSQCYVCLVLPSVIPIARWLRISLHVLYFFYVTGFATNFLVNE